MKYVNWLSTTAVYMDTEWENRNRRLYPRELSRTKNSISSSKTFWPITMQRTSWANSQRIRSGWIRRVFFFESLSPTKCMISGRKNWSLTTIFVKCIKLVANLRLTKSNHLCATVSQIVLLVIVMKWRMTNHRFWFTGQLLKCLTDFSWNKYFWVLELKFRFGSFPRFVL